MPALRRTCTHAIDALDTSTHLTPPTPLPTLTRTRTRRHRTRNMPFGVPQAHAGEKPTHDGEKQHDTLFSVVKYSSISFASSVKEPSAIIRLLSIK